LVVGWYTQASESKQVRVQADDPIGFMQLLAKNDFDGGEVLYTFIL